MGRKSKATIRRQEILSHFYEVIIEEGLEGASIAKVAKRMDVNPSLLIHYFSTREAMVRDLIAYIVHTYQANLLPDFSQEQNPALRWEDVLEVVSQLNWGRYINEVVFYDCYSLSLRDPEVRALFGSLYQRLVSVLEEEIRCAAAASLIASADPRADAELMVSLLEGAQFFQPMRETPWTALERSRWLRHSLEKILPPLVP
jgi:AcrR family transcriptional regulator